MAKRKAYLSPRTIAFNVHGIRLAVHRVTGEIGSCIACTLPILVG